jgi:hypothetical protein
VRFLALALLVAGCVTEQWTNPGGSQATLTADLARCQYETDRATTAIENPVHAGVEDVFLSQSCMKAKGWRRN